MFFLTFQTTFAKYFLFMRKIDNGENKGRKIMMEIAITNVVIIHLPNSIPSAKPPLVLKEKSSNSVLTPVHQLICFPWALTQ